MPKVRPCSNLLVRKSSVEGPWDGIQFGADWNDLSTPNNLHRLPRPEPPCWSLPESRWCCRMDAGDRGEAWTKYYDDASSNCVCWSGRSLSKRVPYCPGMSVRFGKDNLDRQPHEVLPRVRQLNPPSSEASHFWNSQALRARSDLETPSSGDGSVDCVGVGSVQLYLFFYGAWMLETPRYTIRDRLNRKAKRPPPNHFLKLAGSWKMHWAPNFVSALGTSACQRFPWWKSVHGCLRYNWCESEALQSYFTLNLALRAAVVDGSVILPFQ